MSKQLKQADIGLVGLLLAAVLLLPASAQAEVSSASWKDCGRVHYQGDIWIRSEAKQVGCSKARRVARVIAGRPNCDKATHCWVEDFSCDIENQRKRIICVKGEARVRLRPDQQN